MRTIKVSNKTHERLGENHKLKNDTYDKIINRGLDVYENVPEIQRIIESFYRIALNTCRGDFERTQRMKARHTKILSLLADKVN